MGIGLYPSPGSTSWTNDDGTQAVIEEPANLSAGIGAASTLAGSAFQVWGQIAVGDQQAKMAASAADYQNKLYAYNNAMRAITMGVKQFAADKNRIAVNEANVNNQQQIELSEMQSTAKAETQAAFLGASSSAKAATLYSIHRNAVNAKMLQETKFEAALQQIQLSEYSDNMSAIQSMQPQQYRFSTPNNNAAAISEGVLNLANKSIKSGAWDKDSPLRTFFSDLFNKKSSAALPEED